MSSKPTTISSFDEKYFNKSRCMWHLQKTMIDVRKTFINTASWARYLSMVIILGSFPKLFLANVKNCKLDFDLLGPKKQAIALQFQHQCILCIQMVNYKYLYTLCHQYKKNLMNMELWQQYNEGNLPKIMFLFYLRS